MNRPQHLIVGSISAVGVYFVVKDALQEQPTMGDTLLFMGAGAFVGILPDILEPATSPWHRGIFHSSAMLCVMGYLAYRYFWAKDLTNSDISVVISVLAAAYSSHLVLDSCTPMGLPLITSRF